MRGTNNNRASRRSKNRMYWFWVLVMKRTVPLNSLRRQTQQWASVASQDAQRDLESGPSRLPTETDPEGTLDARVVDVLEDDLEADRGSTADPQTADRGSQRLTVVQMEAINSIGRHMLLSLDTEEPEERSQHRARSKSTARPVRRLNQRPKAKSKSSVKAKARPRPAVIDVDSQSDSSDSDGAAQGVAVAENSIAHAVVVAAQEPRTCRICLEQGSVEGVDPGPLYQFGVDCDHEFHTHCILEWAEHGSGCPICRGPLNITGRRGSSAEAFEPLRPTSAPMSDEPEADLVLRSPMFSEALLRSASLSEQLSFLHSLGVCDRLVTPLHGPGSTIIPIQAAADFVQNWMGFRGLNPYVYFSEFRLHPLGSEERMPHYWVEARLAEEVKINKQNQTSSWKAAFHGSNMSCLYAILKRGFLDTGPRGKTSNRHGRKCHYGVFCHKHGTKKKAANYMYYFQYSGFIAAAMLELKVHGEIACGDQWCCDPSSVQIEAVWFHVVPIRSVGLNRYQIFQQPWQSHFEVKPRFGPFTPRYTRG